MTGTCSIEDSTSYATVIHTKIRMGETPRNSSPLPNFAEIPSTAGLTAVNSSFQFRSMKMLDKHFAYTSVCLPHLEDRQCNIESELCGWQVRFHSWFRLRQDHRGSYQRLRKQNWKDSQSLNPIYNHHIDVGISCNVHAVVRNHHSSVHVIKFKASYWSRSHNSKRLEESWETGIDIVASLRLCRCNIRLEE